MRAPSWKENMDAGGSAPYGIRWGVSPKGSTVHIMEYSKYSKRLHSRCGRGSATSEHIHANVYLKSKICKACTKWTMGNRPLDTAYKADWAYHTDPVTGRTKRERHK